MHLQNGTVEALFHGQKSNPLYKNPILQIVQISSLQAEGRARYKGNLSDGAYYMKAVFSSEASEFVEKRKIKSFTIIKLERYDVRVKENNSYLYINELSEVENTGSIIGNPISIYSGKQSLEVNMAKAQNEVNGSMGTLTKSSTPTAKGSENSFNQPAKKVKQDEDDDITEIRKIFPHKKNMTFKGRIVSKSDIRKFTTQKGDGKLFSFDVADSTGQIKCVAFSEAVDIFYPLIENNAVYTISNGTVKLSNKKFSNSTSDFEVHLEKTSEVRRIYDDSVPKYSFNFIKISELQIANGLADVAVVAKEVYPVASVTIKSTGKENLKREVIVVDQTGSARLTIWGPRAEEELEKDSVLIIKSVKVGEYNGISLSTIPSTQIAVNLDIDETVELLSWYNDEGKDMIVEKPKRKDKLSLIGSIKDQNLEYASVKASVLRLKEDSLYYESCPGDGCSKKVTMEDNGNYRCEKCNRTYESCNYRYMSNLQIGDFTGQIWVTIFDQNGPEFFGATAKELKDMGEENPEEVHNLIKKLVSKEFVFKIRSKQDTFNGEQRLRSSIMDISSVDYVLETKRMLDSINSVVGQ